MANQLAMDKVQSIKSLRATGMSQRRIAKTLGISRKAVRRHLEPIPPKDTKAPTGEAPTGSEGPNDTKAPTGSECPPEPAGQRCRSLCGAYRETILAKLEQGLTAQRIYQDLQQEHGFPGRYSSVRRFVQQLIERKELPFRRLEVEPGYEMQVDYGTGARCESPDGKLHRTHVFRSVLSFSRKGYSEAVRRLTTESFIRSLENAFWALGGVPGRLSSTRKCQKGDGQPGRLVRSGTQSEDRGVLPALPVHAVAHPAAYAAAQGQGGTGRGLCEVQRPARTELRIAGRPERSLRSGNARSPIRGSTAPRSSTWASCSNASNARR